MSDRPYWCEICQRKKECYGITLKPTCFVPITNTASGTPESYLAKSLRYSRDSHEIDKTESNSEKPNNCEHITEDGVTCAKYPACDDCLGNPLNKVKGSKRLLKGKTEPTISKMEQVDKDINVRSKDEPTTQTETQNSNLTFKKTDDPQTYVINPQEPTNDDMCFECDDFFTCGGQCNKIEDEPQINGYQTFSGTSVYVSRIEDEPQTDVYDYKGNGKWERSE